MKEKAVKILREPINPPISGVEVARKEFGYAGNVKMSLRDEKYSNAIDFILAESTGAFPPWIDSDHLREFANALLDWADELGV